MTQAALFSDTPTSRSGRLRTYRSELTAVVNHKGVLDVDTVKGCAAGMAAAPGTGCYGACYAASIARFRGIDFTRAVSRTVRSFAQARDIERAVQAAPHGFFRVGTMGDPSHDWPLTVETVEWLGAFAVPVIVTKHWRRASDDELCRLVACGAVLNTSVSALDTEAQLAHRLRELERYAACGGRSVARVVSCDFVRETSAGARMGAVQDQLVALPGAIDNPLRAPQSHPLVKAGVIWVNRAMDLNATRSVSRANDATYLGRCAACPDVCGVGSQPPPRPVPAQRILPLA